MMRFLGNFAGVILALFVLLGCLAAFSLYTATRSHPDSGYIHAAGLKDSVEVYRNPFGIPHIIAGSEADAFYTMGYMHAQDRLWQMDMMRRAGSGRLAEVLGEDAVPVDKFMRALEIERTVKKNYPRMSKTTKFILQAYASGVNAFIADSKSSLPFEFDALDYAPALWEPSDCLVIGRAMALELSMGMWSDIAFGKIADKIGMERAKQLVPDYPLHSPTVMETGQAKPKAAADTATARKADTLVSQDSIPYEKLPADTLMLNFLKKKKNPAPKQTPLNKPLSDLQELLDYSKEYLGIRGSANGSNSWVMKKTAAKNSGVILANDPHLSLTMPPKWYQAHITAPGLNVIGNTIPGIPLVIAGRNDYIAWGITNVMADDIDFFIEKLDSAKKNVYLLSDGKKAKFGYIRDTIKIKGKEDLVFDLRKTTRSAVISDVHLYRRPDIVFPGRGDTTTNYYYNKYAITFSWTGKVFSDEIFSLYKINKARAWNEFLAGVNTWGAPALNFSYADRNGNMGIAPSGLIPKRGPATEANFPNEGSAPGRDWTGFYSGASLPRVYNPQRRWVASANNKTSQNLSFFVSNLWEPPSRAERIEELLSQYTEYTNKDAEFMQTDANSPFARQVLENVMPVLNAMEKRLNENELASLNLLRKWDGTMSSQDAAPLIFNMFMDRMYRNTYMDEIGELAYLHYTTISNIPTRRMLEMLGDSTNVWFDDVATKPVEDKNTIIRTSFRDAVKILQKNLEGKKPKNWLWSTYHTLSIPHIFSRNEFMKPAVTPGPYPANGSNTTLNSGEWKFSDPYKQVVGASMRFIADMNDSLVYMVLPGGISGQPLSAHFTDQLQLWLNGGYVRVPISPKPPQNYRSRVVLSNRKM